MKSYKWFLYTFIIIVVGAVATGTVYSVVEKLPTLDAKTFEDTENLNNYFEKAQTTLEGYEAQKSKWEKEQTRLEETGKTEEAEELGLKITEADTSFSIISEALNEVYTDPTQTNEQTIITINDQIESFNTSIDSTQTLINEIKTTEKKLGSAETLPSKEENDQQASPSDQATNSSTTAEWLAYEKNQLPNTLKTMRKEIETTWQNVQESTPEQMAQKAAEIYYTSEAAQREILANLEKKIPLQTSAEYQSHKTILEDIISQTSDIAEFDFVQNRIYEIQTFLDNPPPGPKTTLDSRLNLSEKVPSDQISALKPSLIEALNNKDVSLLQDIAKSLDHYNLSETYSDIATTIQNSIDSYQKEQIKQSEPQTEPTTQEQQEQGYLSWMLEGIQNLSAATIEATYSYISDSLVEETAATEPETQEPVENDPQDQSIITQLFDGVGKFSQQAIDTGYSTVENAKEAAKIIADVSIGFVEFTAVDASKGIARVAADAVSMAESNLENKKKAATAMNVASKASTPVLKIYDVLPEFVTSKIESYAGKKAGQQTVEFVEDTLTQLNEVASMITYVFAGERAAYTVNDTLNEVGSYLKDIGADQALIDATTSIVEFTAEKIKNNPELVKKTTEVAASFLKNTQMNEYLISTLKKAEQFTGRLAQSTQEAIYEDLSTAQSLIESEKNRVYQDLPTSLFGKFKLKVKNRVQNVKDAISNIFKNSEAKLSKAKTNYTTARNDYLSFIGIQDPALATQELISRQLATMQNRISDGETGLNAKLTAKTKAYLKSQTGLAQVYADYQNELNGTLTSFETITTAWENIVVPTAGPVTPEWVIQNKFSGEVISLFGLRDAKMAHINTLQEAVSAIAQEATSYTNSDFNPLNQAFIENVSKMVNNELVNTLNLFDATIANIQNQIDQFQTNLGKNLGVQN